jgi:hypothetical protein
MVDPARSPGTGVAPARSSTTGYPGTPRWVKVFGIVAFVLVLLVIVVIVSGVGGQHGPARHLPSGAPGGPGGQTPPAAQAVFQAQA